MARAEATASEVYRQLSLFGDVFERVRTDYVEKPDDGKLIESAINGMLAGLDPHSSYMDSKSLHEMQVEIRGEFGGVGIEVTMEEGSIKAEWELGTFATDKYRSSLTTSRNHYAA
jgi:carboxyl-terminal processing protease